MRGAWLAGWRPYLLLGALCLCLYLPGIAAIPVLDRDEARFAQATRQMLETGDFLYIRFENEARNSKPAGIYWLQAASVGMLSTPQSTAIWPYRIPSLLGASLAVLLTFGLGRELTGDPRVAMIGAVLLATALGTVAEAHIAKTDAALLGAVTAGQGMLGLAYIRARGGGTTGFGAAAVFWLAEIAAIFLKGPLGPGLAIVSAATLSIADRDIHWLRGLRPLAGLLLMVLAVVPWLYAIQGATQGQFLAQSVGHDFLSKVFGEQESHGAPPLYYLGLAFLTFWPGSLFLVPTLIRGWLRRGEPGVRFLLAWLVPAWIALELVPTKLPHYPLPLYPALALLSAGALLDGIAGPRWIRWTITANTMLWLVVALSIAAALIVAPIRLGGAVAVAGIVSAAVLVVLATVLLRWRPGPAGTTALLAALALALVVPAASAVVPALDRLWLSREAAAMLARHERPDGTTLSVVGDNEPSLVFQLNGGFKAQTADVPIAAGNEALVSSRDTQMFEQELAKRALVPRPIDRVHGLDYSNGQEITLTLYRIEPK